MQAALASSKQEQESNDAEWDARHQEAVDSAEQWKEFADKLSKEKEEQQQHLASVSAHLQASTLSFCCWLFLLCCFMQTQKGADSSKHARNRGQTILSLFIS